MQQTDTTLSCRLQSVTNLIGPEAFKTSERHNDAFKVVVGDAADLGDRAGVAFIKLADPVADFAALRCQADPH